MAQAVAGPTAPPAGIPGQPAVAPPPAPAAPPPPNAAATTQMIGTAGPAYATPYQQAAQTTTMAANPAATEQTLAQPAVSPMPWNGPDLVDQRKAARQRVFLWGGIAAGVVVVAVVAGLLLSSAFGGSTKPTAAQAPSQGPTLNSQAQTVDSLLNRSSSERSGIQEAVSNIRGCRNMAAAAATLRSAADQRTALLGQLSALNVDKLPQGPALSSTLAQAWRASATFDQEYAAYADDAAAHQCNGPRGAHYDAAVRADGQATAAKKQALALWNPVAAQAGLKERQGWEF